ncbi:MAG: ComF family protein [Chthonomonadaceae bacterium]|nr:ComF family protein [Chthonomonadaceae bacterium]
MLDGLGRIGNTVLDWLYPPKCCLCGMVDQPPICPDCLDEFEPADDIDRGRTAELDWSRVLFAYEGRSAQAVRKLKYNRSTALASPMSGLLVKAYTEMSAMDAVLPVPIHPSRRRHRGFNQSDLLCQSFATGLVQRDLLVRIKKTRPQVELKAHERLINMEGAFLAPKPLAGKSVLLVDDVLTTGGTAIACAKALKVSGAIEVGLLAFCSEKLKRPTT